MVGWIKWAAVAAIMVSVAAVVGCQTIALSTSAKRVSPSHTSKLPFLQSEAQYAPIAKEVYGYDSSSRDELSIVFTMPPQGEITFFGRMRTTKVIDPTDTQPVKFAEGVYPFQIKKTGKKTPYVSGAMAVYGLNKMISLSTIGLAEDTQMFNMDMVSKARSGILAEYTITFDGQDIVTYWMGNRRSLDLRGGTPTAELDFSKVPGISELKVGQWVVRGYVTKVDTVKTRRVRERDAQGRVIMKTANEPNSVEFTMTCDGKNFRGYIQNMVHSKFTTFMRIPCAIPQSLLDAASRGTVAKYTILSPADEDGKSEKLAELAISGM